jgi:Fic family protein
MPDNYNKKLDYSKFRPVGYPVRHRQKISFQPMVSVPPEYRNMVRRIRDLDHELGTLLLGSEDYMRTAIGSCSDNIFQSIKFEGSRISKEQVMERVESFMNGPSEQSTEGSGEIFNQLQSYFSDDEDLPWNMDTVKKIHRNLMGNSPDSGIFRIEDMSVPGADETEYLLACPPQNIQLEMESLIEWLNSSPYDEIVTATVFFHEFESIHPFLRGSGKTGRAIFRCLLKNMGLSNCGMCRYEEEILSDRETYYNLLAYTDATGSYSALIMYITESLFSAYGKILSELRELDRSDSLDGDSRIIIRKAKEMDSFSLQEASSWLPKLGYQTLRKRIDDLIEFGILEKNGKTKSLRYSYSDPLKNVKIRLQNNAL